MPKLKYTLDAVNQRLKAGGVKVRIVRRGAGALSLQATLPPKPLSGKSYNHQQRIPLGLSSPVEAESADGQVAKDAQAALKKAENEARVLHTALLYNTFSWSNYRVQGVVEHTPGAELIEQFRKYYCDRNSLQPKTWTRNWLYYLQRLPQTEPITAESMIEAIERYSNENTETRKRVCGCFSALAKFAKIELDLSDFEGSINNTGPVVRDVPTDEFLIANRPQIVGRYTKSQTGWQWLYSIMLVAGTRPHECFFCEWGDRGLDVLKGKTGPRTVPYKLIELMTPGFIDKWDLRTIKLPGIDAERAYERGILGVKVAQGFGQRDYPTVAYNLRHAFALRGIKFGVPSRLMARAMGHSENEHRRTYRQHISDDREDEILDRLLGEQSYGV